MRDQGLFQWWTKRGDPSSLNVDDTAILIENVLQLPAVLQAITHVGVFTGLTLNLSKTITFIPSGPACMVARVEVNSKPVKYVGTFLGLGDLSILNFEKPLKGAWNNL